MKQRLGMIAIICLLVALGAGGFAVWSYLRARAGEESSQTLQHESFEFERRSDMVKGMPEERALVSAMKEKQRAADEALARAKSQSRLAVISGLGSIVLILGSVALIILNLRKRGAESQSR